MKHHSYARDKLGAERAIKRLELEGWKASYREHICGFEVLIGTEEIKIVEEEVSGFMSSISGFFKIFGGVK